MGGHIFILFSMDTSVLEVNGLEGNTSPMKSQKYPYVKKNRFTDPSDFQEQAIEKNLSSVIAISPKNLSTYEQFLR